MAYTQLTNWGRATSMRVGNQTIIDPDNGLPPVRRQAIIWTIAGILLIGLFRPNFSDIFIEIHAFSFTKMPCRLENDRHFVSAPMC